MDLEPVRPQALVVRNRINNLHKALGYLVQHNLRPTRLLSIPLVGHLGLLFVMILMVLKGTTLRSRPFSAHPRQISHLLLVPLEEEPLGLLNNRNPSSKELLFLEVVQVPYLGTKVSQLLPHVCPMFHLLLLQTDICPVFGNPQQNTTTPSLFGNNTTTTGTGLFGNTQQNQQAQQNTQQPANPFGNLFGQKAAQPTGSSLFGGGTQTSQPQQQTSMFGNAFGQSTQGNSLFNNKPATSAIGTSLSGSTNMGTSLFNSSTANAGAQGTLTASIAQPIGENLPIFDLLPPGPRIIDLDQNLPKKKVGFFLDMPTRSPVPRVTLGYTPANSKLRGFGSSTSLGPLNASNSGISLTTGKVGALALNKSEMLASSVGPDFGRSGSPALGSGGRQSVKKVILDKKVDPSELFVKSGSPGGLKSSKVTFSPQLSIASREKDAQLASVLPQVSSSAASRNQQRSTGLFGTKGSTKEPAVAAGTEPEEKGEAELDEGDYWVKPELSTLKKAGHDELSSFPNLVVGRKGYGEIQFLEPVDLTGLPKLGALLGNVVRFDDKECSVYPDSDDVDKPPPGSGLNVKARLILERCWANDKATREPIKDPNHPLAVKHLKRLKNMKDTHFESFDMKTGTWTFVVDHF